jgi:hypothetical protein
MFVSSFPGNRPARFQNGKSSRSSLRSESPVAVVVVVVVGCSCDVGAFAAFGFFSRGG